MNTISSDSETIKTAVRRNYGAIATSATSPDKPAPATGCCGTATSSNQAPNCGCSHDEHARTVGYSETDLSAVPTGSNLGLGCGNPVALATLRPGQTVLDLGSGAGFDAFLAMRAVGPTGQVIGVDMTPEMITQARANIKKGGYKNVEFRLGEIVALPVADASVDVIISNCVINLCPDKRPAYLEAFRVLKPGGRIAISDLVAQSELPVDVQRDLALHCACLSGATLESELRSIIEEAGFIDISIRSKGPIGPAIADKNVDENWASKIHSAEVTAVKPGGACCAPTR